MSKSLPNAEVQWLTTRSAEDAVQEVTELFASEFGGESGGESGGTSAQPEGVWSAPGRVNLIGEHVDYAGGISVPFALSQRTYVAARANGTNDYRVASLFDGEVSRTTVGLDEVGPGNPSDWSGYVVGTIWAAIEAGVLPAQGLDLAIVSDVPVGAGLSSSAALECSAGVAAAETGGVELEEANRTALMNAAIRAENEVVGASTGGLDQRISLFGQEGHALAIDFAEDSTKQVPFAIAERGLAVLIMNTNAPHSLADGQYASRRAVIDGVTEDLGVSSLRYAEDAEAQSQRWAANNVPEGTDPEEWAATVAKRVRHVVSEIDRTAKAIEQLEAGDMEAFGESMQASHASLRDDYEVTVPQLDVAVDVAMAQGALGARMTGGGFGGSAIALIDADRVETTAQAVADAFAEHGFAAPEFVVALPSDGARRDR